MLSLHQHTNHFKRSLIMKRFAGMMPREEIKKEKHYKCEDGTIIAQAGPNGWTVIWADNGTNYKDNVATTEENFQSALTVIEHYFPGLTGNDFDGRAEADAKIEKFKIEYTELVDELMTRITRDFDVMISMFNEYPSREEYFRRRDEEHLEVPLEDKKVLSNRKYDEIRRLILSMPREEFLSKLKEKILNYYDEDYYKRQLEKIVIENKDRIRFYDTLPCSMAIKLSFSDDYSFMLSLPYRATELILKDYTQQLEREMQFRTRVSFDIDNGYKRFKVKDNKSDPESFHTVRDKLKNEIKEYIDSEVVPMIEEKFGSICKPVYVSIDTIYGSERIIYPDGTIVEDD